MTDTVIDKGLPATETDSASAGSQTTGALLFRHRLVQTGGGLVILLILLALLAPALTRWHLLQEPILQNQNGLDTYGMPLPPARRYLLGTDNLGRDVLSRVIYGARVSLTVGVAAMLTATVIGLTIGLLSGFYGGKLDMGLMRFTDMNLSIPSILLAIAFAGLMDGKIIHLHPAWMHWSFLDLHLKRGMVSVFLIVGFVSWPGMVRVIRGQVLSVKEHEYVYASRALGASDFRVIFLHLLPNVLPTVIVLAAMTTANTIILEAGLDYLNVGVPPPAPTWGGMIDDGQDYFIFAPLIVIAPGVAILLTVLGFNLLGQGLQEVLNPHQTK
jgi:peptide/nickel transport system permease protein